MKKIIYISYFLFISCETTLDIKLPESDPKLVINSYMIADQFWNGRNQFALVSNSIQGIGNIEDYIYTDSIPVINNATAIINEMDNSEYSINQYQLLFDNTCYCYTNQEFTPRENKKYELNVSVEGYPPIRAVDIVPSKAEYTISNFELFTELDTFSSGNLCQFNISLKDLPNIDNYYILKIYIENTTTNSRKRCIYEVEDPSFLIPINRYNASNTYYEGVNGYFTDDLFDGQERNMFVKVEKPEGVYNQFYIEIITLSDNLYNFNLTRKEQKRDSDNYLFNSEAIFIDSNIEGGYGIFGARAKSQKVYIPTFFPTNGWIEY
tara:strand:- start:419 stop:1384 length:966 start_codon:yes stop_codon:yes gene_type:complete